MLNVSKILYFIQFFIGITTSIQKKPLAFRTIAIEIAIAISITCVSVFEKFNGECEIGCEIMKNDHKKDSLIFLQREFSFDFFFFFGFGKNSGQRGKDIP